MTRDWQLTQEFWQHIVAVCVFIGVDNVRALVLPLLEFHAASVRFLCVSAISLSKFITHSFHAVGFLAFARELHGSLVSSRAR